MIQHFTSYIKMSSKALIKLIIIMLILMLLFLVRWNVNWFEWETRSIIHKWFSTWDIKQDYVWYAYKLWWIDFVAMLECENGNRDITKKWDNGKALGLCQLNKRWHKRTEEYKTRRQSQVETCYRKRSHWTKFNWLNRKVNWMKCKDYVLNRFIIIETWNIYEWF